MMPFQSSNSLPSSLRSSLICHYQVFSQVGIASSVMVWGPLKSVTTMLYGVHKQLNLAMRKQFWSQNKFQFIVLVSQPSKWKAGEHMIICIKHGCLFSLRCHRCLFNPICALKVSSEIRRINSSFTKQLMIRSWQIGQVAFFGQLTVTC